MNIQIVTGCVPLQLQGSTLLQADPWFCLYCWGNFAEHAIEIMGASISQRLILRK
jgi:hypothetical protein